MIGWWHELEVVQKNAYLYAHREVLEILEESWNK